MRNQLKTIAVLGAGSWGTALALCLARRGQSVNIWSIDNTEITAMLRDGSNERYLPGHRLPPSLKPFADLEQAIQPADDILIVVPSVGLKTTLSMVQPFLTDRNRFICATKGLDADTGALSHQVLMNVLGDNYPFAALSGPSFAREVAAGLPTAVIIASSNSSFRKEVIERFHSPIFHAYPSDDVTGVEVGGVVKNVIAIATGISDGMALGTNARSALITCGLAEIKRLGIALGAKAETFAGLAGMGDLILTCSDDQSRNRRFGLALGQGKTLAEAEKQIGQVVEGKRNAELVHRLAAQHQVNMPICRTVTELLQGKYSCKEAFNHFLEKEKSAT